MSIEDLIKTEIYEKADEAAKRERQELRDFLVTRGGTDYDG